MLEDRIVLLDRTRSPSLAAKRRHACDGENLSPQFKWTGVPAGARSLALILHDPDAPKAGGFTHWVIYGIDPKMREIEEGVPKQAEFTDFGIQGKNDGGGIGYTGPCPPAGTHQYVARLYALDVDIDLGPGAPKRELEESIRGHIVGQAALMGTYTRKSGVGRQTSSAAA